MLPFLYSSNPIPRESEPMASPSNSTITINGDKFNAMTAHFSLATPHDHTGMPHMGQTQCAIAFAVDLHDTDNMPNAVLKKLFDLSHTLTRDKIVPMKIEYWTDESQFDAICTYSFNGWVSEYSTGSGGSSNHTLHLRVQPTISANQFMTVEFR